MQNTVPVLLALYIIASVADCIRIRQGKSRIVKPFLMPLLTAFYLAACAAYAIPVQKLLVFALLCSFAGDVFLVFTGKSPAFLVAGGFFFGCAHVFYSLLFSSGIEVLSPFHPVLSYLACGICILSGVFLLGFMCRLFSGHARMCALIYMLLLFLMCFAASVRFWAKGTPAALVCFAGSLLFVLSDTLLAQNAAEILSHGKALRRRPVMQTYLLAQLLITASWLAAGA